MAPNVCLDSYSIIKERTSYKMNHVWRIYFYLSACLFGVFFSSHVEHVTLYLASKSILLYICQYA